MPRLDHIHIHARDPETMVAFFEAVLDARDGPRPPFQFPGHWLYLDGIPAIHISIPERDSDYPPGAINHAAFGVYDYEPLLERVMESGFSYKLAGIPGGVGQIFVTGPEGVLIELQYYR